MPETAPDALTTVLVSTLCTVLVLLVKAMVDQLRRRKNGHGSPPQESSGDKPPAFWQSEQRKAMTDVVLSTVVPILSQQTTILAELRSEAAANGDRMIRLMTLIEERMPRRGER